MFRMCFYMHSRFIENHLIWILEDGPSFQGGGGVVSDNRCKQSNIPATQTQTRRCEAK
jgi:hypothetical protein